MPSSATDVYRAARDQLLALRGDHAAAVAEFRWPTFDGPFNWAVDWFDAFARRQRPHRRCTSSRRTAARPGTPSTRWPPLRPGGELAARRTASRKGDRVVLMLGNQVELWESMLAVMKLGAVIMPTTTALGPADLIDRIERGGARHVLANAADTGKFDEVPGDYTRIAVGGAPDGWLAYADTRGAAAGRRPATPARCPATRCSSTSPAARPAGRSWSSTPRSATRSATCRRCTGSACSPATCTSTSARPAGPSTPGAASSRRGSPRRRSTSTTTRASTRRRC